MTFDPHKRFEIPFDEALKELMEVRELSTRGVAGKLQEHFDGWGASSTISLYSQGKMKPTTEAMERLALALDVEPRVFAEYRLAMARTQLDPEIVGLKVALDSLRRFELRA